VPTATPTAYPTTYPTAVPTATPTAYPTTYPTASPTASPPPACRPGQLRGNKGCVHCAAGKYSRAYNAKACLTCANGKYATIKSTGCTDCQVVKFHATSGCECSACAASKIADIAGIRGTVLELVLSLFKLSGVPCQHSDVVACICAASCKLHSNAMFWPNVSDYANRSRRVLL
jgi:hypothetical protein